MDGDRAACGGRGDGSGGDGASASPVHSAANGMYHIPNVAPGAYTLEVWAAPNGQPVKYPNIQVKNPVTDVGPITVK